MKISTVEPVMAIGRFQSIGQNYADNISILQYFNTCVNYISFI
jgi:hypothetical protein